MERYTKKDAQKAFERLLVNINGAQGYSEGCYYLDYNATYGGCIIHLVVNKEGCVTTPFSTRRMNPFEFCMAINFAIRAIQLNNS